jgi:hypothetical protein
MADFSIFLSYRREDTGDLSELICELLEQQLGKGHVFFDVDVLSRYAG